MSFSCLPVKQVNKFNHYIALYRSLSVERKGKLAIADSKFTLLVEAGRPYFKKSEKISFVASRENAFQL